MSRSATQQRGQAEAVDRWYDDRAKAAVDAAARAAADGDPAEALRHFGEVEQLAGSEYCTQLAILVQLGDDAPGWMWSRWACLQVHRGQGCAGGPSGLDIHQVSWHTVLRAFYADVTEESCPDNLSLEAFTASVLQRDWVHRQLCVYDSGGLRRFVREVAGPVLLRRADRLEEWAAAPMGGYVLLDVGGGAPERPAVADLRTGERLDILDLGLLEEHEPGTHLIGRIVPVSEEPGRMFEGPPLAVDEATARLLSAPRPPGGWFRVLEARYAAGRLPRLFSYTKDAALASDVPQRAWWGLIDEAQVETLPVNEDGFVTSDDMARVAMRNLLKMVLEAGPDLRVCRHTAAGLLLEPGLQQALPARFAHPGLTRHWRLLRQVLPAYLERRCAELERACSAALPDVS